MSTSRCGKIFIMQPTCSSKARRRGFSNRSSAEATVGEICVFLAKVKNFGPFRKWMHLGIIKITTEQHNPDLITMRFVNLGEEVTLTLLWQSGASKSATVCFVIILSIWYWLCVCARVCERGRHCHTTTACLQTRASSLCLSCDSVPFWGLNWW